MSRQDRTIIPTISKVYINPNFNNKYSQQGHQQKSNKMHVNPNFTQLKQNLAHQSNITNTRIFVNPNFIRSNHRRQLYPAPYTTETNDGCGMLEHAQINCQRVEQISKNISALPTVSISRYSLVRQSANKVSEKHLSPNPNNNILGIKVDNHTSVPIQSVQNVVVKSSNMSNTIKINKYKTISLNEIKNKSNSAKTWIRPVFNAPKPQFVAIKSKRNLVMNKIINKHIVVSSRRNSKNIKLIRNLSLNKSKLTNKSLLREKPKTPRVMKKNNIPCALFRKYGKCLRASYGKCEFLHDKKHVSICRKFLKGVCHDKDCLLSHDLTSNKMPTCYFYLNGMCTKENCPYLHVKLNEKAKICTDFLTGYCENGDKCLHRHVNLCPDFATKGFCVKKCCVYPHGNKKAKGSTETKLKCKMVVKQKQIMNTIKTILKKVPESSKNHTESTGVRYYRESTKEEVTSKCEVIKPIRCKLGNLPSFIQL